MARSGQVFGKRSQTKDFYIGIQKRMDVKDGNTELHSMYLKSELKLVDNPYIKMKNMQTTTKKS